MAAAMSLVKRHFPEIHGHQNPLRNKSQSKPFTPQPEGSIQIHHTSNHWVTSCYLDGEVKLYDFLYCRKDGIPKELEQQLRKKSSNQRAHCRHCPCSSAAEGWSRLWAIRNCLPISSCSWGQARTSSFQAKRDEDAPKNML